MHGDIQTYPATPERWGDMTEIFAGKGDAGKCWCAHWYLSAKECKAGWGQHQHVLESRVKAGPPPGVLAYMDGEPAGWAGVAPRANFDRLVRNKKVLAPVDDRPVWSLNCLVVRRGFRKRGLMRPLIGGAVAYALDAGAIAIEAYPVETGPKKTVWDLYLGTINAYEDCGFVEVARRGPRQRIMRYWPD
ncbi:MAG: GNAT family N-acetyltransferase [Pseudomonadota bacterium]